MCGIAGIVSWGDSPPIVETEIVAMNDAIAHRGPDDDGVYLDGAVALSNRRLAIIDLTSTGRQPMASDDGQVILVYNGELYNTNELVSILESRGHRFRGRSDTEAVLRAYEEWGEGCVEHLRGMFAFAVYDRRQHSVVIARDRLGIKPLYYCIQGDRALFGSEIKSLIAGGLSPRVCPQALVEYFTFQNILSDLTLFEGVQILPPGSVLRLGRDGTRSIRTYWRPEPDPDFGPSAEDWVADIREAFEEAVHSQLVSDVAVGSYLSGGMDSGSIVAVAGRSIPRLMTFTGGFDLSSVTGLEAAFDERLEAEVMASHFRTEHYEMVLHAGDMAWALPRLVWHLEDLRVGMSYQNYYIARLASKFVKVALAGTGGDELFAGYPWRYQASRGKDFENEYYRSWMRLVPDEEHPAFFAPDAWRAANGHRPFDVYRQVLDETKGHDPLTRSLLFEMRSFLHGLLIVEDRVSMAHGLEVRVPFLDERLVELALRIPSEVKFSGDEGKPLLRRAMADLLPGSITQNRKQGFSPPDGSWYRGETMAYIKTVLLDARSLDRGYFEPTYVKRVLREHLEGRHNHRLLIWSLLSFEWWNRLFVDGELVPSQQ